MPAGPLLVALPPDAPPPGCNGLDELLRSRVASPANCSDGCTFVAEQDEPAARAVVRYQPGFNHWYSVTTTGSAYVFTTYQSSVSGGEHALWYAPLDGSTVQKVEGFSPMANISVVANGNVGGMLVYVVSTQQELGLPWVNQLKVWSPGGQPVLLAQLPSRLKHRMVGVASFAGTVVLSFEDGIYGYSLYQLSTGQRLFESSNITAISVEDTGTMFFAVGGDDPTVHTYELFSDTDQTLAHMAATDLQRGGGHNRLAALNADGVWLLDLNTNAPDAPQLLYGTREFPQFPWLRGLIATDDAVYVGQVCYLDADAPGYGTVRLEPPSQPGSTPVRAGAASWATGQPDWPWGTPVLDTGYLQQGRGGAGSIIFQHRAD